MTALQERIGPVDLALTERAGHATALATRAVAEAARPRHQRGRRRRDERSGERAADAGRPPPTPPRPAAASTAANRSRRSASSPPAPAATSGARSASPRTATAYLDAIAAGRERLVDVGHARFIGNDGRAVERYYVNVLSAGIGGLVDRYTAAMPATVPGRVAYGAATLGAVVACRRRRVVCRATLGDGSTFERVLDTYAVVIANGHTFGGGMRVAPAARIDDGLLDVVLIETPDQADDAAPLPQHLPRRAPDEPGVSLFTCTKVELLPADERLGRRAQRRRRPRPRLLPPRRRRRRARRPAAQRRGRPARLRVLA